MEQRNEEFIKIKKLFINILLKHGKKTKAEKIFDDILKELKNKTKQKPIFIVSKAIKNLMPKFQLISIPDKKKSRKKKNQFFLMFLTKDKQIKRSIIWLINNSFKKKNKNNIINICNEIIQTSNNKSKTINMKKKHYNNIRKLKYNIRF